MMILFRIFFYFHNARILSYTFFSEMFNLTVNNILSFQHVPIFFCYVILATIRTEGQLQIFSHCYRMHYTTDDCFHNRLNILVSQKDTF